MENMTISFVVKQLEMQNEKFCKLITFLN